MAGIALRAGADMGRRLGLRILGDEATAMTGRALTLQSGVVHLRRRKRYEIVVAAIATRRSWNMGRILAQSRPAIVTGGAGSRRHQRMGTVGRHPGIGSVTGIAHRRRRDMQRRLAGRNGSVMAVDT